MSWLYARWRRLEGVDCTLRAEQRIAPGAVCAAAVTFDPSLPTTDPMRGSCSW